MRVLISSAGRRAALVRIFRAAIDACGIRGSVLAADASPLTSAGALADELFLVPRCTDPDFIPFMRDLCRRREVSLVVPTIDPELPFYAAHRAELEEDGTTVLVSSPEAVAIAGGKMSTYRWLVRQGFPTPRTALLEEAVGDRTWSFPFVSKPDDGSASLNVTLVRDTAELEVRRKEHGLVAQALAPGVELTADGMVDRTGRCRCVVLRQRLEVRAGEVSKGMTVRHAELEELVVRVLEALPGAYGALTVQLFASPGSPSIIEINPRFGGGYPLAWEAGARFPQWILEELLGRPSSADPNAWKEGVVMLRFDDAVFVDAANVGL